MAEQRTILRAGGRVALAACALPLGLIGLRLLTAMPGYGRTRRGAIALQGFSQLVLQVLGIRVVSRGSPRSGPSLVVANHVCWLDVLVLAAAGPTVPLVDEAVLQRSMIGPIASRIGAIVFRAGVSRELSVTVATVTATLRGGHRVLVFPNARSAGCAGQPFARAAFQAAIDAAVVISPVAVSYSNPQVAPTHLDGFGLLWRMLRAAPSTVAVTWLPVIPAVAGSGHHADDRNAAARRTQWAIGRASGDGNVTGLAPLPVRAAPADVPALALAS